MLHNLCLIQLLQSRSPVRSHLSNKAQNSQMHRLLLYTLLFAVFRNEVLVPISYQTFRRSRSLGCVRWIGGLIGDVNNVDDALIYLYTGRWARLLENPSAAGSISSLIRQWTGYLLMMSYVDFVLVITCCWLMAWFKLRASCTLQLAGVLGLSLTRGAQLSEWCE